jgi:hypothetical protein
MTKSSPLGFCAALITAAAVISLDSTGARAGYMFMTIDDPADPTFNQLLGINNSGLITGYFGSGAAGHPNQGYTIAAPYTTFVPQNFPGSVQTQVTGLNNIGTTVGFWSNTNNGVGLDSNFGFTQTSLVFANVNNPNTATTPPVFNQLLGVNDSNLSVGFYTDAAGVTHGYTHPVGTSTFSPDINDPNAGTGAGQGTTAAAINNAGEIAGFYVDAAGTTHGFIDNGGTFTTVDEPGATFTQLLGLNGNGQAVGDFISGGVMHGLLFNVAADSFQTLDDPNGTTTLNGINDNGSIVGFFTDTNGNTNGLLATFIPEPGPLLVLGGGMLGVALLRRRRERK